MQRILLGLTLLLFGCDSASNLVGNPLSGFGGYVADTHTVFRGPNQPAGNSQNMRRVMGEEPQSEPLLPEAGNVWPGPPPPAPTLEDIEKMQGTEFPPLATPGIPPMPVPGSSTPPGSVQPGAVPQSSVSPLRLPPPVKPLQPATLGVVQTQNGPAVITASPNGEQTYTLPNGSTGRAIPNANGTVTLIGADGSVQSVPAPR
jgi:hypothetical protein